MRNRWWLLVTGLILAFGPALNATAQEGHGEEAESAEQATHGEEAGHSEGGESAAPLLSFDPGVAIWTIVVFVALLVLLRATAWKPILKVLKEREEFIDKSIQDAKREHQEAAKLLAEYREQIDHAREEATGIVDEGKRDGEVVRRRIQEEARAEANQMIKRAKREIGLAKDTAVKELYDETAALAVDVAAGIVRRTLTPDEHKGLVAESLERMKASNEAKLN